MTRPRPGKTVHPSLYQNLYPEVRLLKKRGTGLCCPEIRESEKSNSPRVGGKLPGNLYLLILPRFMPDQYPEPLIHRDIRPYPIGENKKFITHTQDRFQMHYQPDDPGHKPLRFPIGKVGHGFVATDRGQ